jgi:hypothetical protein
MASRCGNERIRWHHISPGSWYRPCLTIVIVEEDTVLSPVLLAIKQLKFPATEGMERMDNFEKSYRECCIMCS